MNPPLGLHGQPLPEAPWRAGLSCRKKKNDEDNIINFRFFIYSCFQNEGLRIESEQ